ncbi:hypothetical protein [Vibrio chagasii]|uniref:hypothetical protein n=1 Tax=Vibrio chagasii TaxID=170679 RepID=UPI003D9FF17D
MTLIDVRFAALGIQGFEGALNDRILSWLKAAGADGATTTDAWTSMLEQRGYVGQVNDEWYAMLGDMGFTSGHINERELEFWLSGGSLPPAP